MLRQSMLDLKEGVRHMERGDYLSASRKFLKSIAKTPEHSDSHMLYGASLYWLGDVENALDEYERAIDLDGKNALAFQLKGIALAWMGRIEEALSNFLIAEEYAPKRSDVKMNIGSIYYGKGKFLKALYYFRKALKLKPDNSLYNFQLGILNKRLGRYSRARESFEKALRLDRNYEDALFQLAVVAEKKNDIDKAVDYYEKALKIKPYDGAAVFRLSSLLAVRGSEEKIRRFIQNGFALTPSNDMGGISLNIVYSGKSGDEGNGLSAGESAARSEISKSVYRALSRLPRGKAAKVKIAVISRSDETSDAKRLSGELESRFSFPGTQYRGKEFLVDAAGFKERKEQIERMLNEIDELALNPAGRNRLFLNIETFDAAGGREGTANDSKVVYNPRMVGNDKGLWIIGHGWIEDVEEALADMTVSEREYAGKPPLFFAVRGLGRLILGDFAGAEKDFEKIKRDELFLYHMGMTVVCVGRGDEEKALGHSAKAMEYGEKNEVAARNDKWLRAPALLEKEGK